MIEVAFILFGFNPDISNFFELLRQIFGWVMWELQNFFKKSET